MFIKFFLLLFSLGLYFINGHQGCFKIIGRLKCPTDEYRHGNVKVILMDKDCKRLTKKLVTISFF